MQLVTTQKKERKKEKKCKWADNSLFLSALANIELLYSRSLDLGYKLGSIIVIFVADLIQAICK